MRFRLFYFLVLFLCVNINSAYSLSRTAFDELAPLVRSAQFIQPTSQEGSGVRLELKVSDGTVPEALTYAIRPEVETPPSIAEGQNGIAPGVYQLTVQAKGQDLFKQKFLAAEGVVSDLKLSYSAASGFTLKQTVELPQVLFKPNQKQVSPKSKRELQAIVDFLNENKSIETLGIEVHTDAQGNERSNLELTTFRAIELRNALIKLGVDAQRIKTFGRGSADPKVPSTSLENRQINRRVEYIIIEASTKPRLIGNQFSSVSVVTL